MNARRFGNWRNVFRRAPESRAGAEVPGAGPVMSPEDAQARLGELRASCVATWEPPDPVALASFLRDVADALQALEPDLSATDTLRAAAADVDDPEALFEAGWELVEVDLDALAVTPLARALTLQPGNVAIVNELALALEAAGSPAEAARLYRENAWAVDESETAQGLYSHFAAMGGDWEATHTMALRIDLAGEHAFFRERALRRVGRATAVHGVARLTDDDVRGWDAVLAGSLLLCRAPDDLDGMNGRFGALWEQPGDLVHRLGVLRALLDRAGRMPTRVVAGSDRDSQVLGWAIATLFGLPAPVSPAEPTPPGEPSLVVLFDWSTLDEEFFDRFGADRDAVLFAYTLDWTRRHPLAPDLVAMQAEALFAPWSEGMRLDGPPDAMLDPDPARRPKLVTVPADDREPQQIGVDLAAVPATPAEGTDVDELFGLIDALRTQPGDVGLFGGPRDQYFPDGPVTSGKFF